MLIEWPFYPQIVIIAEHVPSLSYTARMALISDWTVNNYHTLVMKG